MLDQALVQAHDQEVDEIAVAAAHAQQFLRQPAGAGKAAAAPDLTVAIVGLGYVGLPTAIALASGGVQVIGLDSSAARLTAIRSGAVDLLDSDSELLSKALTRHLDLTTDAAMIATADAVVICVPTPVDAHLIPDLRPLATACASVAKHARAGQTIILTSTSYVGTTRDLLVTPLQARGLRIGADVYVAFSPERINPGDSHYAHSTVPRVVGGVTAECGERAAAILSRTTERIHAVSSPEAAELTKLFENTFRAVNIALANEMATASAALSVDVTEVIDAAATKPYGFMPFAPGPGVGGHCIPCDPHYLLWQLRTQRVELPLVESAMRDIAGRPTQVVTRIRDLLGDRGRSVRGSRIAVVGVAYKPGVEDVRESPALEIMARLRELGAEVGFVDPYVRSIRLPDGTEVIGWQPLQELAEALDLAVLHTRHPDTDLGWLKAVPTVLDATYRAIDLDHRSLV